eukprot:TRINITY_DN116668_c0_g1_i1.p1 TRINITY_DN116668_c0_g1~~TRINITY_DN116668_c0_g1_i1.p1  ORF type:complete len:170 (-),score=30.64 TRINITY_DN116668_c0_g1_i1:93-602(-)
MADFHKANLLSEVTMSGDPVSGTKSPANPRVIEVYMTPINDSSPVPSPVCLSQGVAENGKWRRRAVQDDDSPFEPEDCYHLCGTYRLREVPHNGAACWEKDLSHESEDARFLFRASDGESWVIDQSLHDGDLKELAFARLETEADPFTACEQWEPIETLRIRALPESED